MNELNPTTVYVFLGIITWIIWIQAGLFLCRIIKKSDDLAKSNSTLSFGDGVMVISFLILFAPIFLPTIGVFCMANIIEKK